MDFAFFGQYLIKKGIIDAVQLAKAMELQQELNWQIGTLALARNMLTQEQVNKILELQKEKDVYFGEAAVQLRFLTQKEVDSLAEGQANIHLYLGEALVRLGYITENGLKQSLDNFRKEQRERAAVSRVYPVQLHKEQPFIDEFIAYTIKILQRIAGIIVKYDHCEYRQNEIELSPVSVEMRFSGSFSNHVLRYIMMSDEKVAHTIATMIYERVGMAIDDGSVDDAIVELVNVICGQTCTKLSDRGELKTTVPEKKKIADPQTAQYSLKENEKAAVVWFVMPFGSISFCLVFAK